MPEVVYWRAKGAVRMDGRGEEEEEGSRKLFGGGARTDEIMEEYLEVI